MADPKGNSEFCFPESLNDPRGEAEGNIEGMLLKSAAGRIKLEGMAIVEIILLNKVSAMHFP